MMWTLSALKGWRAMPMSRAPRRRRQPSSRPTSSRPVWCLEPTAPSSLRTNKKTPRSVGRLNDTGFRALPRVLQREAVSDDGEGAMNEQRYQVRVMRLPHAADLPLPASQSAHAAGLDLVAAVPADVTKAPIVIAPGGRAAIPTGLAFALPAGIEGQIRPRSGLALHFGVTVLNSPGTLNADYRGELQVLLVNLGSAPFIVERGARIAQLVLSPTVQAEIHEVPG